MICIYMSDEKIRIIDGIAGSKIKIRSFHEIDTKTASLESGNIKDLMAFSQTIQDCLQTNKITPDVTYYVIDNSRIVFREMIVPDVSPTKIKQILAAEIFPDGKLQNNTLDYVVEEGFKSEDKKSKLKVNVTFISNDAIESIHTSGMELGLKPTVLDVAPNCTSKLIGKYATKDKNLLKKTFILVDYKDTFFSIHVFDKYKKKFSKNTMLYTSSAGKIDKEYLTSEIVHNVDGVKRYFEPRNEDCVIEDVYITGNAGALNDCMQDMADSLHMNVTQLPPPSFLMGMNLMDFNSYSCALGAFIRR